MRWLLAELATPTRDLWGPGIVIWCAGQGRHMWSEPWRKAQLLSLSWGRVYPPPLGQGMGLAQGPCVASNPGSATHWLCDLRLLSDYSEPQFPHL